MSTAFSDLRVWQRPMDLAFEVYQLQSCLSPESQ
jgi:hypothetical protein